MEEYENNRSFQNKYTFAKYHNELLDWDFVSVIEKNELTRDSNFIGIVILVMIFLVTVLGNIFSKLISNWIYHPLYQMSEMIQEVGEGKRKLTQNFDDSEVGKIGKQFKEMVNNNLELRENLLLAQVKDRESELLLLQSQINPHFLYNTLDSICCMAIIERQDQIAKMVECLSRMFRLSLNQGNKIVQLKDEVEQVKAYMEIQSFRFHDRFELILDIPKEIESIYMLKFVLQPFVENAMYHGLEPKRGKGKMKVWGEERGGFLYLYIEDNGVGMEDVNQIYQGYGVKNVIERINLYYGNECGVEFESNLLEGTKVKIKICSEYQRREELGDA
ncbi:MAG TPA: sensor histidine kinase, partial [Candidatus Merdenecus merdavium]|nr:sensor histidine kinase [Candidatus Merdenecus merdavium]